MTRTTQTGWLMRKVVMITKLRQYTLRVFQKSLLLGISTKTN